MSDDKEYTVKTDHDLPTIARVWGNSWKVIAMEYLRELQKAGKGIRRLKNKLHHARSVKQEPLAGIAIAIAEKVRGEWAELSPLDLNVAIRNLLMRTMSMEAVLRYYYPNEWFEELKAITDKLAGRSADAFDTIDTEMAKLIRRAQAAADNSRLPSDKGAGEDAQPNSDQ